MLYFGCWGQAGHYLFGEGGHHISSERLPAGFVETFGDHGWGLDAKFCPGYVGPYQRDREEHEGEALLHHVNGWTVLAFWDRSVDKRGGCNSNFVERGTLTFEEMCTIAQAQFPSVWARYPFKVRILKTGQTAADYIKEAYDRGFAAGVAKGAFSNE